jgi:hypothetical protein
VRNNSKPDEHELEQLVHAVARETKKQLEFLSEKLLNVSWKRKLGAHLRFHLNKRNTNDEIKFAIEVLSYLQSVEVVGVVAINRYYKKVLIFLFRQSLPRVVIVGVIELIPVQWKKKIKEQFLPS